MAIEYKSHPVNLLDAPLSSARLLKLARIWALCLDKRGIISFGPDLTSKVSRGSWSMALYYERDGEKFRLWNTIVKISGPKSPNMDEPSPNHVMQMMYSAARIDPNAP